MKKILVIDDDQFFGKTLGAALPKDKYKMITAENGKKGLELLQSEKPDLVILDLMMPEMDGTEFLTKVKESNELSKIPVLVSSNLSSMKKISDCMALGAKGYVIKSDSSMESIVSDIERILGEGDKKKEQKES